MHITLRRGGASADKPDPIVNGYTRMTRGLVARIPYGPTISTGPGINDLQMRQVSNAAGVLQAQCSRASPWDTRHTFIGIKLGTAWLYMSEDGAIGGPSLRTPGGKRAGMELFVDSVLFKLAIEPNGALRAWVGGGPLYNLIPGDAVRGVGYLWQSSDPNARDNNGTGFYSAIVACADNALHFANCPPNGKVDVVIGAEAPVTVNLDGAGAGVLDVDYRTWPLDVRYTVKDAALAVVAQLEIPASYGGDVIGVR